MVIIFAAWTQWVGICFLNCLAPFKARKVFNPKDESMKYVSEVNSKSTSTGDGCESKHLVDKELRIVQWLRDSKQWRLDIFDLNVRNTDSKDDFYIRNNRFYCSPERGKLYLQQSCTSNYALVRLKVYAKNRDDRHEANKRLKRDNQDNFSVKFNFTSADTQLSTVHSWFIPMVCSRCRRRQLYDVYKNTI